MAFEYEKLLENDTDYGLDSFLRAITKAAYDQGFAEGVRSSAKFEQSLMSLQEVVARLAPHGTGSIKAVEKHHAPNQLSSLVKPGNIVAAYASPVLSRSPARFAGGGQMDLGVDGTDQKAGEPPVRQRVRRGLVQDTVAAALVLEPGLTIKGYEELVAQMEPEISSKSVGNELRRGEQSNRYKRDRPGGYRWYLVSADGEAADQVSDQTAASDSIQGGGDGTDNMT